MIVREVLPKEKDQFNALANHPLQTWEWGEFRKKDGKRVIRLGAYDPTTKTKKDQLKIVYQLTAHPIPYTDYSVLYFPRGPMPDQTMIRTLNKLGQKEKSILVKMAPDIKAPVRENLSVDAHQRVHDFLLENNGRKVKPFWFEYTYQIDLTKSEEKLLAGMHQKTRYNLRLSQKHGVEVAEDNSDKAFKTYLELLMETTKRQGFYAHTPEYHQKLWQTLGPNRARQNQALKARLLLAKYKKRTLAAWLFFIFKDTLYYPYGASSPLFRKVMPAYSLMWEAIKFGKKMDCKTFDLWGCLGPDPDPKDPWLGFHRFKTGFGGQMVKFLGSYDLVIDHRFYPFYNLVDLARWQFLKIKRKLPF